MNWNNSLAQESPPHKSVAILESRFSTTTPIEGELFRYFLKYDSVIDQHIFPEEHFSEYGLTVIETKSLDPQRFEGRLIQQFEYTLKADAGTYEFSPISLKFAGPLKDPVAVQADLVQLTVQPIVDVRIDTNSPLMLHEALTVKLLIFKHQPVTITALPHEFQADFQVPPPPETPTTEATDDSATPPPPPSPLQFEIDQSAQIMSQEVDGQTVDTYAYNTVIGPQQAGIYSVPSIVVNYRTASGKEREARTPETQIFILHPNNDNLDIDTDYGFLVFPAIIVAAMILTATAVLLFLRFRKQKKTSAHFTPPSLPPGELAHQELADIQAMKLPSRGEFKTYYSLVSEAVRKFLGAEFGFHVLERTTEEVMYDIHQRDVPSHVQEATGQFLREADMVKFAKYIPLLEEAEDAMQQALAIVDESVEYHRVPELSPTSQHEGASSTVTSL